jgi:hypothetical protein
VVEDGGVESAGDVVEVATWAEADEDVLLGRQLLLLRVCVRPFCLQQQCRNRLWFSRLQLVQNGLRTGLSSEGSGGEWGCLD